MIIIILDYLFFCYDKIHILDALHKTIIIIYYEILHFQWGNLMKELNQLQNIKINEKEGYALFSINPKIYPLDLIYSASYILMDKAYIFLDGDPEEEIIVELRRKDENNQELKKLVYDFNNELLNYAVYKQQSEKNKPIREAILQKILLTNDPNYITPQINQPAQPDMEDPEGILKLWEESEQKLDNDDVLNTFSTKKLKKNKRSTNSINRKN